MHYCSLLLLSLSVCFVKLVSSSSDGSGLRVNEIASLKGVQIQPADVLNVELRVQLERNLVDLAQVDAHIVGARKGPQTDGALGLARVQILVQR